MIIAIDFDGTIVKDKWPEIGEFRFLAKPVIKWLYYRGHRLILNTCRVEIPMNDALWFLVNNQLYAMFELFNENCPERTKNFGYDCRKISADWYIDDRAGFLGWWSVPIIILWMEWQEKFKMWWSIWQGRKRTIVTKTNDARLQKRK